MRVNASMAQPGSRRSASTARRCGCGSSGAPLSLSFYGRTKASARRRNNSRERGKAGRVARNHAPAGGLRNLTGGGNRERFGDGHAPARNDRTGALANLKGGEGRHRYPRPSPTAGVFAATEAFPRDLLRPQLAQCSCGLLDSAPTHAPTSPGFRRKRRRLVDFYSSREPHQ